MCTLFVQTVSTSSAPRRIGPIGNERGKPKQQQNTVENISTLFPSMNDQNVISFIASNEGEDDNNKGEFSDDDNLCPIFCSNLT